MYKIAFFYSFLFVVSFSSCFKSRPDCEEPMYVENSSIIVSFKDKDGKYMYDNLFPTYNKDSLRVIDEHGNLIRLLFGSEVVPGTTHSYTTIDIGPVYNAQTDMASFSSEVCKKFYIWYNKNEKDTIKACFISKNLKCGSVFESLKVYHRDSLLAKASNTAFITLTLTKN